MPTRTDHRRGGWFAVLLVLLTGCGGEPSEREVKNAQAFEALLTAVSLQNRAEVDKDAKLIDERHSAGELSEARYQALLAIITSARQKDWASAEKLAYEFRAPFKDGGAFFK